jgi:hypothetical protein
MMLLDLEGTPPARSPNFSMHSEPDQEQQHHIISDRDILDCMVSGEFIPYNFN